MAAGDTTDRREPYKWLVALFRTNPCGALHFSEQRQDDRLRRARGGGGIGMTEIPAVPAYNPFKAGGNGSSLWVNWGRIGRA